VRDFRDQRTQLRGRREPRPASAQPSTRQTRLIPSRSPLPTFLTVSLHAGSAALGVIEGTSDALTGFSKLAGGGPWPTTPAGAAGSQPAATSAPPSPPQRSG
jgi:hypothetical protein